MKCYHHMNEEAVASCSVCGRALCQRCASLYNIPYCSECAHQLLTDSKKDIKKAFIEAFLCGIAVVIYFASGITPESRFSIEFILVSILIFALAFCIPFGLRLLDKITADRFLILPIIGWIIYVLFKFIVSFFIGWIALPIYLRKAKKLEETVTEMESIRNL